MYAAAFTLPRPAFPRSLTVEASVPAWGVMIADARNIMYQSPWNLVLPILAVFVTVFGFNLLGDGLRRTVDPRLARRAGS